jgi:hypothetical protein
LTAQRRYVDEMLRIFAEMAVEAPIAENAPGNVLDKTAHGARRGFLASASRTSMGVAAGENYQS